MEEKRKTRVIMIRHGESEGNAQGFFAGQTDVPLTPRGVTQAERTAEYLKDRKIDRIYSSDLIRSMQTAAPTARVHQLEIHPETGLREINGGKWEHVPYDRLSDLFPQSRKRWMESIGTSRPDGGESVEELAGRVRETVERLVRENPGRCIALFTHALPIRAMGCLWQGIPIPEMSRLPWSGNAAVTEAEYDENGEVRFLCYGYEDHQKEIGTSFPQGAV